MTFDDNNIDLHFFFLDAIMMTLIRQFGDQIETIYLT